jgi:hypothetical protein
MSQIPRGAVDDTARAASAVMWGDLMRHLPEKDRSEKLDQRN